MEITMHQTRIIVGVGLKHKGDTITVDDRLGQQLIGQKLASRAKPARPNVADKTVTMTETQKTKGEI